MARQFSWDVQEIVAPCLASLLEEATEFLPPAIAQPWSTVDGFLDDRMSCQQPRVRCRCHLMDLRILCQQVELRLFQMRSSNAACTNDALTLTMCNAWKTGECQSAHAACTNE